MILPTLNNDTWLFDLRNVTVSDVAEPINVTVFNEHKTFFQQTLFPDNNNTVTLYNVKDLLQQAFLTDYKPNIVTFSFQENDNEPVFVSTRVHFNSAKINAPVSEFYFKLLARDNKKITFPFANEIVALFNNDNLNELDVTIEAVWDDETVSIHDFKLVENNGFLTNTLNVNQLVHSNSKKLLYFFIKHEQNGIKYTIATYIVDYAFMQPNVAFQFINTLGVPENIYIFGITNTTRNFEKLTAMVNYNEVNYKSKLSVKNKVSTAILHHNYRELLEDFFNSNSVHLLVNNLPSQQVIIDEIKHETANNPDALDAYQFNWRFADSNQQTPFHVGIFDFSFDQTFN